MTHPELHTKNNKENKLYKKDIEYFLHNYNIGQGISRFTGAYLAAGFRYWRHSEEFDKTPKHPNIDYKAFFELFDQKILQPEDTESGIES